MDIKCLTCGHQSKSYYETPCSMCTHCDVERADRWTNMVRIDNEIRGEYKWMMNNTV